MNQEIFEPWSEALKRAALEAQMVDNREAYLFFQEWFMNLHLSYMMETWISL